MQSVVDELVNWSVNYNNMNINNKKTKEIMLGLLRNQWKQSSTAAFSHLRL